MIFYRSYGVIRRLDCVPDSELYGAIGDIRTFQRNSESFRETKIEWPAAGRESPRHDSLFLATERHEYARRRKAAHFPFRKVPTSDGLTTGGATVIYR